MTKTAFLFAGQGAQYLGMGRDLYDHYPIVKETIDQASQVLGYDLRYLIDTEEEKLNQTRYTQPAILATSVAIYRLLQEKGHQPDMVAGLSLGEYSALVASGALDFEDAVALVAKRGVYMEEAAPAGSGKMVAVLNTPVEVIEEACQKASELGVVNPANYNTPAQIVIGGEGAAEGDSTRGLERRTSLADPARQTGLQGTQAALRYVCSRSGLPEQHGVRCGGERRYMRDLSQGEI